MRKLAPVFLSTLVLMASGSALALGDMHKNKKAPSTTGTPSSTYNSGSATTNTTPPSGTSSMKGGTSSTTNGSASVSTNPSSASTYDSTSTRAAAKSIGDRCDKSVHATLPPDCRTTGPRSGAATNSTQGESGAASGGPAGSPGSSH